jgi:LuxR family transcriptional regulator, quorum-sensing system regulator SdiA
VGEVNQATLKRVNGKQMDAQAGIRDSLESLKGLAPTGFAIALHVKLVTPTYLFQTYPKEWIDYYSQNGLVMRDPTVHWAFDNIGTIRWAELSHLDADGIIGKASTHGMRYGVTVAAEAGGSRSLASFTRGDRDYEAAEMDILAHEVGRLHEMTASAQSLSAATRDALTAMSIQFTHP